jgi:hypothetical protein
MHNLYSCIDPTPFPRSEYGGLIVVSAKDEEEAIELIYATIRGDDIDQDMGEDCIKPYIKRDIEHIGYAKDDVSEIVAQFST